MTTKTLVCSALLLVLLLAHPARPASVPPQLPFSAVVRVDGADFSGPVQLKFTIVAQTAPDNNLWANDGTDIGEPAQATAATALDGVCRIHLGDTHLPHMRALPPAVFASAAPLVLRVWLQAGNGPLELLDPDTPLLPAPFAFNSALLDGYAPQAFASTAATYQLAADLTVVAALLPNLSNDVLAVRSALAAEVTNRVHASAALSNLMATALLAHSATAEFALAALVVHINAVSDQFVLTSAALASNLVAETALRAAADTNLAADIAASLSNTAALVEHTRADLTAYTDAATNATLGSALVCAYAAASNLNAAGVASNQQWALATFLNKHGDRMSGPLRVGQILMLSTNMPGYLAAGITAHPEANGFYNQNDQTNNSAPVFSNISGVLLYRYMVDSDGFYEWRIGPNLSGTPYYAMQPYVQDTLPPVTQWSGATLSAAVWTNTALIDFAGGFARNLAPAADASDAVILGQLTTAHDELAGTITMGLANVATNIAVLAHNLTTATNAVTSQLQRLFVTHTAPGDIIITNGMSQAAARATLSIGQSFVPTCDGTLRATRCWPAVPDAVLRATLYAGVPWDFVHYVGVSTTRTTGPDGSLQLGFAPGAVTVSSGQTYTVVLSIEDPVSFNECPGNTYPRGELCVMDVIHGGLWLPDVGKDLGLMLSFDPVERTRITADGIALANGATVTLNGQNIDDRFLNAAGDTLTGDLNANGKRITNLPAPDAAGDAVSRGYLDTATNALRGAINNELTATYATHGYVDTKQFGPANIANGAVSLAKLNTASVDTRYIANTGAQQLQGPLALAGAGDWQVGSAAARADIVLKNPAAQIRSASGDLSFSAPANQAIRLQSFTHFSAEQFGRATIPANDQEVHVTDKPVTSSAVILLTPCGAVPGAPYAQIDVDGTTFWIKLSAPVARDTVINYLILAR